MRGYTKGGIAEEIRAAGGELYAVTSEPQSLASKARTEWKLSFETVGDPHHEIAQTCRDRGWLELFVNERKGLLQSSAASTGWTPQHPKGYFQPGVLALTASGRVLYRWRCVPKHQNMGGATERPTPAHVWSHVTDALSAPADAGDAGFDESPALDMRAIPWPLFVALLIANGWFVRARVFPYTSHGLRADTRVKLALLRVVGFAAAWTSALWWLPTLWVVAAFAIWAAWITPQVRFVNEEFQHVAQP